MTRKKLLVSLLVLVVLAGAGFVLLKSGLLPVGGSPDAAVAETLDGEAVGDSVQVVAEKDEDGEEKEIAVPVELSRVERRAIAAYYKSASTVEADRLVELTTKVEGRITTLNVEEGDWVEKGDVLAEIENEREKVQLRQSELKLADQQRQLERNRAMVDEGLISESEFDVVRHAFEMAEADRDLARIVVEETRIRAPFSGQITDRKIVLGQQLNPAQALFTLADFSPLRVRVHLPEGVARKVVAGQRVLITPETGDRDLEAVVERVSPVVDPNTSTVRLTMRLNEGADVLRAGGFVKARITTDTHSEALSIPKLALIEEGGLRSVFVAEADTVRKVEINTGLYDESYVEILDGVEDGAFVVTIGQGGLRTGSHIEALNAALVGWDAAEGSTNASEPDTQVAKADAR
jgi:RND family efflux transporter MFP subunit